MTLETNSAHGYELIKNKGNKNKGKQLLSAKQQQDIQR